MSRNNLIKDTVAKLEAANKIHSRTTVDRTDTWKITGRKTELVIEWKPLHATKFTAPPSDVLNAIIVALRSRVHVK